MMIWESIVMGHLTARLRLLIRPQYEIAWDKNTGTGGTCPDFIAIDPKSRGLVYIIEVSAAWDLKGLNEKFENRRRYWYDPLDRDLSIWDHGGPFDFRSVAYIRKDAHFFTCNGPDVERRFLEDVAFEWKP